MNRILAVPLIVVGVITTACVSTNDPDPIQSASRAILVLRNEAGLCSAVSVTKSLAVTNAHCVQGAESVTLRQRSGAEFDAAVVAVSPKHDLALVKSKGGSLRPITIASGEDGPRLGETVYAIGHPLRQYWSVTKGIISYIGREIEELNHGQPLLQTDAAVHPGSSGGALVDSGGRLVGVVVGTVSPPFGGHGIQLSFAIPVGQVYDAFGDRLPPRPGKRGE